MKTFYISGQLVNDDPEIAPRAISGEFEAESSRSVIDMLESYYGLEFNPETLVIWEVSEADKLEAMGAPALFELPERELKTKKLSSKDIARRLYWRYYQTYCATLIDHFGLDVAKKVRVK